jgi:hypothetical protein
MRKEKPVRAILGVPHPGTITIFTFGHLRKAEKH